MKIFSPVYHVLLLFLSLTNINSFYITNQDWSLNKPNELLLNLKHKLSSLYFRDQENSEIVNQLIELLLSFLSENANPLIISQDILFNEKCRKGIFELATNTTYLQHMINSSGKSFNDIGLETDCEAEGLFYLFTEYHANMQVLMNETEYLYLYNFLEQERFYTGYCVPGHCIDFYKHFLNKTLNKEFFDYLLGHGINDIIAYIREEPKESDGQNKSPLDRDMQFVYITLYILLAYISIKLIICLIGFILFKICDDKSISRTTRKTTNSANDTLTDSLSESASEDDEDEFSGQKQKRSSNFIFTPRKPDRSKSKRYSKCKYCFYSVYKFMNIKSQIKYVSTLKNKYFNDTGLEYITFFRFFTFFWIIFNQNVFALLKIPHRDFTNYSFFTSIYFTIIKYSTFSAECWVMLDGLVFSYKLMSYLKKENEANTLVPDYSFCVFFRFYCIVFTRFFLFFFIFMIHLKMKAFGSLFVDSPVFDYYVENINNNRLCVIEPYSIFIPFYLQYSDINQTAEKSIHGFTNCFRFVNIFMNEFYCFTFMTIIFYFVFKFKSKIFDYFFTFLFIVNLCLSFLSYSNNYNPGQLFTFIWVLGENTSQKYTHLFINAYIIGIFTGLIYFYFNDVISSQVYETDFEYLPFKFCFDFMKIFDRSKKLLKRVYFYSSIVIQILISMSFYFFILIYSKNASSGNKDNPADDFYITINPVINFVYIYEKKIFLIFFIIMMLSFLFHPKVTPLKLFIQSNIFVWFTRHDFVLFCIVDTCVYMFLSLYNNQIFLNIPNMMIITIGLLILIFIIAFVLNILFELPFRVLYKAGGVTVCKRTNSKGKSKIISL